MICLSCFSTTPQAQLRHAARRLQRRKPGVQIVAALWNVAPDLVLPDAAAQLGVQAVATTLADAVLQLQALLRTTAQAGMRPATGATTEAAPSTTSVGTSTTDPADDLPGWSATASHTP